MNYEVISVNKSSSLTQGEDKEVSDGLRKIHRDFQKMDFHNYVNKEISFVRSIDIMMYARGKTYTTKKIGRRVHPGIWTRQHDQCSNDDSISNRLRLKL